MIKKDKHLIIIGGVAAGMKAAAKARRESAAMRITVLTDEEHVSYAGCGMPYFVGDIIKDPQKLIIRRPEYFKGMHDIDVLTHHQVVRIDIRSRSVRVKHLVNGQDLTFHYDKLIIATGAQPVIPPLPGVSLGNIFTLRTVTDAFKIKSFMNAGEKVRNAVVVGGGLIGLEMAENLVVRGVGVTVVELFDHILPPLDKDMALLVQNYVKENGVEVITSDKVESFEGEGGNVTRVITGKQWLPADIVILSVGIKPNTKLAQDAGIKIGVTSAIEVNERMETNIPDVYAAGDCAESTHLITGKPAWVPLGSTAAKMGRVAAVNAAGGHDTLKGILGTLIVKVFEMNVGKVGLSEREAVKEGFTVESVIVPAADRAHYYPGGKEIITKLIADAATRKLLGAEIIGTGVVDKRIDTIATALTFGATVKQVSQLDLAYAPPYAMAMDAIIVAANVLDNKLQGKTAGILPQEVMEKYERGEDFVLLDVRTEAEYKGGHIRGCRHIPLDKLASRVHELDGSKEIITYCRAGLRAAHAYRILRNAGLKNVRYMDGSILAWPYGLEK